MRLLFLTLLLGSFAHAGPVQGAYEEFAPLFKTHCYRCHNEKTHKGDIRLDNLKADFARERELWDKVEQMIDSNEMPPKKPFLTDSQRVKITDWINTQKDKVDWSAHR